MISTKSPPTSLILFALAGSGCVSAGAYRAKVAELEETQKASALLDHERRNRIDILEMWVDRLSHRAAEMTRANETLLTEKAILMKSYDDSTALVGELEARLKKLGQNVDRLAAEKGQMSATLEDAKKRFEALRTQKLAAEERAAIFRLLAKRLHGMIDAGDLTVVVRDGRMLLVMPTDVLFDSGRTEIKEDAKAALVQIGQALASIEGRRYQIAGHTDDVPIHTRNFASNWELSTQRAVEVTKLLIESGLAPNRLSAAGYGEYDPIAPNDSDEQRARNRRIEITVLPNLEELPSLDDLS